MAYDNLKMQDITVSEKSLFMQYQNLWSAGNIVGAIDFLNTHQELKYKVLNAYNWNRLCNLVNDGTLPLVWDSTKEYKQGQMATQGNYVYVAKQDNTNQQPPNATYWKQLYATSSATNPTSDSLVGEWNYDYNRLTTQATDFKYIGVWDSTRAYKKNNLVKIVVAQTEWTGKTINVDKSYFAIQDVPAGTLVTNATYWIEAQKMNKSIGLQVSSTAPNNLRVGDIYLQEITE